MRHVGQQQSYIIGYMYTLWMSFLELMLTDTSLGGIKDYFLGSSPGTQPLHVLLQHNNTALHVDMMHQTVI